MNSKNELIEWLRDAYAMEKAMDLTLKKQITDDETLPQLRERFEVHHAETQRHAELLEDCLKQIGSNVSTLKTTLAETIEMLRNAGVPFVGDQPVKALIAAHAAEHFEIGCYTALAAGARHLGLPEIARTCEHILEEEKCMADWLESNLPQAVFSYLQKPALRHPSVQPSPPRRHVEAIDTPIEAGADDDPADAWLNHELEDVTAKRAPQVHFSMAER